MAKPESWRLDRAVYPTSISVSSRYQDLDPLGHINNVAMSGIFESGRVHIHYVIGRHPAVEGVRWLVAAVDLIYVREAHFPQPVQVCNAIGRIGNSSWTVIQAAFQDDECVATCETVMVMQGPKGKRTIDDVTRISMERYLPIREASVVK
jgi:acyl-CoA thioester hydrolase